MRDIGDPTWARYYAVCGRAHLAANEGRISGNCLRIVIEQARRRAYREQVPRLRRERGVA